MTAQPLFIHGLGPVGLTLAIGARALGFSPTLIGTPHKGEDARAWSLLPRTRAFLSALGVEIEGQDVAAMRVWQAGRDGEALNGHLDFEGDPVSTIMPGTVLNKALQSAAADIPTLPDAPSDAGLHLITQGWPLQSPRPKMTTWGYAQTALSGTVRVKNLGPEARQVFLPTGPLAVLPLPGGETASMIWSVRDEALAGLKLRPDLPALASKALGLEIEFDPKTLSTFPLTAAHARTYVGPGFAVLGDAAHRVHPLAGVGLNLGLGDVGALLDALVQARRTGTDLTTLPALMPYEKARRAENESLIFATDALARLFGQSWGPLQLARGLGMSLVNRTSLRARVQGMMSDERAVCAALQG